MQKRALLCGINNYKHPSVADLRGCLNDLANVASLLTDVYGFDPDHIHVLEDKKVRKKALKDKWKWLLRGSKPGDELVFHFSGHGSYLPDTGGDESDGQDSLLCLWDMDWGDPGSYLLDDEIDEMCEALKDGVNLTIITDNCHAGTGTKYVMPRQGDGADFEADVDLGATQRRLGTVVSAPSVEEGLRDPQALVQVRFLPPPGGAGRRRKTTNKPRAQSSLNHLHVAACRDDETAADAYLGGSFNGALTHSLCAILRARPGIGQRDAERRLQDVLSVGGFNQHARLNGQVLAEPFFGLGEHPTDTETGAAALPDRPPASSIEIASDDLAHAHRKLADAHAALTEAHRVLVSEKTSFAGPKKTRAGGTPALVYVHGIGNHRKGYSDPWWEALQPHVGGLFENGELGVDRFEVEWSHLVNDLSDRAAGARDTSGTPEELDIWNEIESQIAERNARYAEPDRAAEVVHNQDLLAPGTRGSGGKADDFMRYLFQSNVRRQVLDTFDRVAEQVQGRPVHLISHSWGTVVAYEALMERPISKALDVQRFFTVGSALSLRAVRWKLGLKNRMPDGVTSWYNLDAKGDGVGGSIGRHFPVPTDHEFLALDPVGCERSRLGYNLGCAHSSYFRPSNLRVNENIFAQIIRTVDWG